MIENFQKKDDKNRNKVIRYLKESKFDLEKYVIQELKDYPGGLELIDEKQRRIAIYNDYLLDRIQVIFVDLQTTHEELKSYVIRECWEIYLSEAERLNQIVKMEKIDNNKIQMLRAKVDYKNKTAELIHKSQIYDDTNDLYDLCYYFETEIGNMQKQ